MRLPTKSERISPSILDVRVPNGKKIGKSNKEEADAIIKHIAEITSKSSKDNPRSIGIISLMGAEQSQLIRSGLLEAIGPHEVARHDILVGDPPTFQGTERDSKYIMLRPFRNVVSKFDNFLKQNAFSVDSNFPLHGVLERKCSNAEPVDAFSESQCGDV